MKMTKKGKFDLRLLGAVIILVVLGGYATWGLMQIPVGWEIGHNFDHMIINDTYRVNMGDDASSSDIYSGYASSVDGLFKIDDGRESAVWGDAQQYSGTTKIRYTTSATPVKIRFDPTLLAWIPDSTAGPHKVYSKNTTAGMMYYEQHVYQVDFKGYTMGESVAYGSAFHGTCDGLPSCAVTWYYPDGSTETIPADREHDAEFRVKTAFVIQPWAINVGDILVEGNNTYEVTDAFMGVMSATVIAVYAGHGAGAPEATFPGHASPVQQEGSPLSMFTLDESAVQNYYQTAQSADASGLGDILGVPTAILMQLTGSLEPGLHVEGGAVPGTWASATPVNNQIHWTVRVDVLTALGVELVVGDQPTITTNFTEYYPPPKPPVYWWDTIFADIGEWFSNPMNVLFLAVMAVVILWFVSKMLGGRKITVGI
jgi:hypothetical protein